MDTEKVNFYLKETLINSVLDLDEDHIKNIGQMIRNSYEYKKFISDKRINEDQNHCNYLKDFDFKDSKKAKLQLHHVIYLRTLVRIATKYLIDNKQRGVTTFEISNQVIKWHYQNIIPYIFLSTTIHQLYHDGQYTFELKDVRGNYKEFLEDYSKYFDAEVKEEVLKNLGLGV